jgi:hypothetical protein
MKPAKPKLPTKVNRFLRFQVSKNMVADIDYVIATVPQLCGFSRSRFLRAAVRYALECLAEDGYVRC